MSRFLLTRTRLASILCAGLLLAAAGCKDSDTGSGGPATKEEASAAVTAAKAEYEKYVAAQPDIEIPTLPGKPASGKDITVLTCPLQVCAQETEPAVEAAKKLGWNVTSLSTPLTAEGYQSAIEQIVANPTEFVAITPLLPNSFITDQLDKLKANGSKVVQMTPAGTDPSPEGPINAVVNGIPELSMSGQLMGDTVVNDAGADAKVLFVWDPQAKAVLGSVKDGFEKTVEGAGGDVADLEVATQDIGKAIPGQVVSYLQAHPDVEYLAFVLSDAAAGVPQALKSAGLSDQVKIISRAPSASTLADVKSGVQWATVGEENASNGWRVVDLFARMDAGVELGDLANPAGWHQIFVQDNITQTDSAPATPGVPDVFLKAWHLQ